MDRDTAHTAKSTEQWAKDQHVPLLLLPPKAADINWVENVQAMIDQKASDHWTTKGMSFSKFRQNLLDAADSISPDSCSKCADSLSGRMREVIKSGGDFLAKS